ncbi:pilus assembly protein [Undibacterium sp. TJN25]|uniref:pilus assembly protein n=1 Tax=Undibacterium sp. TJN25 TaxID=3413056 RepID=UPI003BF159A5
MNAHINLRQALRNIVCVGLSLNIIMPLPALAATVNLATAPLANATATTVKPNLMFILDESGSMANKYLGDYVGEASLCKNTGNDGVTNPDGTKNPAYNRSCVDQAPYQSADYNGIYYNPTIRYSPAMNADGTEWPNQTSWTSVNNNAFKTSDGSTNLVTGYADTEWCTDNQYGDCLRNDNHILPGTVNGKAYTTVHSTTSTGSGFVATGSPVAPTTVARTFGPHYYTINAGEYCDSDNLTNCQPTASGAFTIPATVRWCKTAAAADADIPAAGLCQRARVTTTGFTVPRYPTRFFTQPVAGSAAKPAQAAVPASVTFSITFSSCSNPKKAGISAMKLSSNSTSILSSATPLETSTTTLASDLNGKGANGYTLSSSGNSVTITAPVSAGNLTTTVNITAVSGGSCTLAPTATGTFSGYKDATAAVPAIPAVPAGYYGSFVRTDIVSGQTYPKATTRTDCAGATCTYTEEMTNFANWFTYYQARMQMMKTSVSRAFQAVDDKYRVGFIDIYGTNYLPVAAFAAGTGGVKDLWYKKLFSSTPSGNTPLRDGLDRVGRLYAGYKLNSTSRLAAVDDPIQYSCQQNFALLTTDGYWNGDNESIIYDVPGTSQIGNLDSDPNSRPKYEGPTPTSFTLADVGKYFFDTDLRNSKFNNCSGNISGVDVCSDSDANYSTQRMTTFTLGLGVNGVLNYTANYATATSGDFYNLTHNIGNTNWPVPANNTETAVDDLWHAAVNGGGTYFSAKDPSQLITGLNGALRAIAAAKGAGAAAATSTLNPVTGDSDVFLASYTTVKWTGNLERRTLDPSDGTVSKSATWCAENIGVDTTAGINACSGTMSGLVGPSSDSRKIYISNASGAFTDFTYANLSTAQQAYFSGTFLSSNLSQWTALSSVQQGKAQGSNLVNYLRGQTQYDGNSSNNDITNNVDNRLFRQRDVTLGDITESQPAFVGKPNFSYTDAGYAQFIANRTPGGSPGRAKMVYVGSNDGMLHAFDATTGIEKWAYIPKMVIPNLWVLADNNYATKHANFVNGAPVIADVYSGSAWHTILVAGLNGGGRGYYALDITDPAQPKLLWEIDQNTDADVGYSFGHPVITKKLDGTWVVLLTSGYNNTSPGTGEGVVLVRDAYTGAPVNTATGSPRITDKSGTSASPSGLAKLAVWADSAEINNTAGPAYGGDLNGDLWRFDVNAGTVLKLATLKDASNNFQPITTEPMLGNVNGTRVVFVGTGKYLEISDLLSTGGQSIYAIKDDNATATLPTLRTALIKQTISGTGSTRAETTPVAVDFKKDLGWFVDLPDSGERVNVDPMLDAGTLFVPSTVPSGNSSSVCSPAGYGYLNYFDYLTGHSLGTNGVVSQKFDHPIVGMNIVYLPDGSRSVSVVTSDDPTPKQPQDPIPDGASGSAYHSTRVIWRELIPGQ